MKRESEVKTFEDVFDVEGWQGRLQEIKRQGVSDVTGGRIVGLKWTYEFALLFAEMHEQARRGDFFPLGAVRKLRDRFTRPQIVDALNTVIFLMENGLPFSEALSYRPAVFSAELIAAVKAGEKDNCNYAKHLLNFVKYRELLGAMHNKFKNRDYDGLRDALL